MKNFKKGGKNFRSGSSGRKKNNRSERSSEEKGDRRKKDDFSGEKKFKKSFGDKPRFSSDKREGGYEKKKYGSDGDFKPRKKFGEPKDSEGGFKKKKYNDDGDFKPRKRFGERKDDDSGFKKKRYSDDNSFKPRKRFGEQKDDEGGFKKKRYSDEGDFKSRKKFTERKDEGGFKKKRFGEDNDFKPRKRFGEQKEDEGGFKKKRYSDEGDFKSRKKFTERKDEGGFKKRSDDDRNFKPRKRFGEQKGDEGGFKKKRYSDDNSFKPRKSFGEQKDDEGGFKKKRYSEEGDFKSRKKFTERKDEGSFKKRSEGDRDFKPVKSFEEKESGDSGIKKHPVSGASKKFNPNDDLEEPSFSFEKHDDDKKRFSREKKKYENLNKDSRKKSFASPQKEDDGMVRLNKYLSNAGICSRREADMLIESGVIKVNGKVVTELGTKIYPTDKVSYGDQTVKAEALVYLLLNKPKDYITTVDDPDKRRTVMELIKGACKERIYPVGRLDRNTTGLLLFTNDGELTLKLTHPKNNIRKVYHVVTDQNVSREDMEKLRNGLELEDGFVMPDDVDFVGEGHNKKDIGVEIHSGKNRVVRRMFEHLGYNVVKLDRVMFAGLTKKDLPRGKWRLLTKQEIGFLKKG